MSKVYKSDPDSLRVNPWLVYLESLRVRLNGLILEIIKASFYPEIDT